MSNEFMKQQGSFIVGCNYWASHAGTAMWSDWKPEIVEMDLKKLSEEGLQVLRVFPLWPDFQPLTLLRGGGGSPKEFRHGEIPLSDDEAGAAGVSKTAIERFEVFTRIADKYGFKLIVGLVTGWMSGRLFIPRAMEGRNVLTDPVALMWQVRFVRYFVGRFKDCPVITAWDLGNECNCMGNVPGREAAWLWTSTIVNAIKSVDTGRPVVSGMHGMKPEGNWRIQDQGELTDVLTTHPYPIFTPYCDYDPVNTIRTSLHATSQSRFYSEIGNKPCFAEELGTLGPMVASEDIAADFVRTNLFSLWAHDCRGLLWWCACDQTHLEHAPYDWCSVERELGLLRVDGSAKPVLSEMGKFRKFLEGLPFDALPSRVTEGVCILSEGQEQWGVAYGSFVLAKQAGIDIEFQYEAQPLKDSSLYLLPSVSGHIVISRRRWLELLERVKAGAVLYISHDDGFLSQFEEVTGLQVQTRQRQTGNVAVSMGDTVLNLNGPFNLVLKPVRADVIGADTEGNPVFTCAGYGKGRVYFLSYPLEKALISRPGSFHAPDAEPYWQIYNQIGKSISCKRIITKELPEIGITEHPVDAGSRIAVVINYSPDPVEFPFAMKEGWVISRLFYGDAPQQSQGKFTCTAGANDALVFSIRKE